MTTKRGRPPHADILTPREWEVLALIEEGRTNEQIAERLGISFGGAKFHVAEILSKLNVNSREDAVRIARSHHRRPVGVAGLLARIPHLPALWRRSPWGVAGAGVAAAFVLLLASFAVNQLVFTDSVSQPSDEDLGRAAADFEAGPEEVPASSPPAAASATPNPSSCPIDAAVCDFALELLPLLRAGDVEGFVDRLEPVEATCRQGVAGFGGPSPALCAGAADGEVRRGYWNVQAGEGLIVTEGELKASLERWFPAIEAASGNDAYGAGELQIGAVACARARGTASGECSGDFVRAFYTFINPPNADVSQGTGIPGQRTTFHVSMHFDQDGRLRADGFGTTVPPNAPLDGGTFNAIGDDGSPLVLEFYPWRP